MANDPAAVARPYAEAAHKHVRDADVKVAQQWQEMLTALAEVIAEETMQTVLKDPRISLMQAQQTLDAVLTKITAEVGPEGAKFKNFAHQLLANERLSATGAIAKQFVQLRRQSEGVLDVEIRAAFELDNKRIADIAAGLKDKFKVMQVNTTVNIDDTLGGGIMIIAGDDVIDGSIQAQLGRLHVALRRG